MLEAFMPFVVYFINNYDRRGKSL